VTAGDIVPGAGEVEEPWHRRACRDDRHAPAAPRSRWPSRRFGLYTGGHGCASY
jgi:hypothetical protein